MSTKMQKRRRGIIAVVSIAFLLSFSFYPTVFAEEADAVSGEAAGGQEQVMEPGEAEAAQGAVQAMTQEEVQATASEGTPDEVLQEAVQALPQSEPALKEASGPQRSGPGGPYRIEGKGYYNHLHQAYNAAEDGDTILVVEDNVCDGPTIDITKKITIEAEGGPKTITIRNFMIRVQSGGDVTLGGEHRLTIKSDMPSIISVRGGKLRLANVDLSAFSQTVHVLRGLVEYIANSKITASTSGGIALFIAGGSSGAASVVRIENSTFLAQGTDGIGILNHGTIGSINSGYFEGGQNAVCNIGTIGDIKGGAFIGRSGAALYVAGGGSTAAVVGKIVVQNPGDAYFAGGTYALELAYSSSVRVITGHGIYRGGSKGTIHIQNKLSNTTLPLEQTGDLSLDLTETGANPGNGRYYAQDGNYFTGNPYLIGIPRGYHMSMMDTAVKETKQGIVPAERYHFLVKDNTIVYVGNGENHPETTGKAAQNIDIANAVFVAHETPEATVKANGDGFKFEENGYVLSSWNTKPDGSGTTYMPGDTYQFEPATELVLYAQWEQAPVPPEITDPENPDPGITPPTDDNPVPVKPGKVTKVTAPRTGDLLPRYIAFLFFVSGISALLLYLCNRKERLIRK